MDSTVQTLAPILKKTNLLIESMIDFLSIPHISTWPEILAQFNILIAKYESLLVELKPTLRQMIVHPKSIQESDPDMRKCPS